MAPEPSFKRFLTPPALIGATAFVALVAVLLVFYATSTRPQGAAAQASVGSITAEVAATGAVKAAKSVDLAFQRGGTIASISTDVGRHVAAGQELAVLNNADLTAARAQAAANVAVQQAALQKLLSGTRTETLAADRAGVADAIHAAYIAADDAVHNRVDQFVNNPRSATPTLTFTSSDSSLQNDFLTGRTTMEGVLTQWQSALPTGDTSAESDLVARAKAAEQDLVSLESFLGTASALLVKAVPTSAVTTADIQSYETSVATGRTAVSTALTALTKARGALALDEAGASGEDVQAQQAAVAAAAAALTTAEANLSQTVITAPISGTVTRQDGNAGEAVAANQSFISINSDARFQAEAYIAESDLANVKVGAPAAVTLDAYPNQTFDAKVIAVDPAATVQNGVPSYKVTVQFTKNDSRIKAGLTANVAIEAGKAQEALLVPASAIITRDANTYVLKLDQSGQQVLTPVSVGLRTATEAQILSGLSAGDRVVSFGSAQ